MLNGYIAFGPNGKRCEVRAVSSYEAQTKAAKAMGVKPNKQYTISVHLAEKAGEDVTHTADF